MWFTIGPLLDQLTLIAMFAMFYFLVAVIIIWPWVSGIEPAHQDRPQHAAVRHRAGRTVHLGHALRQGVLHHGPEEGVRPAGQGLHEDLPPDEVLQRLGGGGLPLHRLAHAEPHGERLLLQAGARGGHRGEAGPFHEERARRHDGRVRAQVRGQPEGRGLHQGDLHRRHHRPDLHLRLRVHHPAAGLPDGGHADLRHRDRLYDNGGGIRISDPI